MEKSIKTTYLPQNMNIMFIPLQKIILISLLKKLKKEMKVHRNFMKESLKQQHINHIKQKKNY